MLISNHLFDYGNFIQKILRSRPALGALAQALYLQSSHQALYRAPSDFDMFSVKLAPNLRGTVYPKVLFPDPREISPFNDSSRLAQSGRLAGSFSRALCS